MGDFLALNPDNRANRDDDPGETMFDERRSRTVPDFRGIAKLPFSQPAIAVNY
jgi:hypothetical protein